LTNHWRRAFPKFSLRFGWLALGALLAQIVVIYVGPGEAGVLRRLVFPASYVLLLAFVVLNWRRLGILVIGVGMMLNFLAIVSNGGLMPISPATMERAGFGDELAEQELGDALPQSKNVLLDESDTNLQWLSDRFTWGSPGPLSVFSLGDVFIGAGLIVILIEIILSVVLHTSRDRPSLA
jgi:hypothetical protein